MLNWMKLALESNRVIGLRLAKLMRGGKGARREVERKIQAAAKAGANLMAGASSEAGGGKHEAAGPASS